MSEWLQMLGHAPEEINALNIIHIAGTKGKGSTCAFAESFLRAHGRRTGFPRKIGLYTSPHLILPEERIRIDSLPLTEILFAKYFFEVHDRLSQISTTEDSTETCRNRSPRLLQLYALFAFHVFIRERVDTAILETHCGGEYDATNVVEKPVVTAVTSLGMDHVDMLGPTIENIAWHKAGIYKAGAAALSTTQGHQLEEVLRSRARDQGETLRIVSNDSRLPVDAMQLKPTVQKKNASLALAAAEKFLQRRSPSHCQTLPDEDIQDGIQQWSWPGRFQIIPGEMQTWFLDAAHNDMSVQIAAQWFAETSSELSSEPLIRVLIFSHISELRDAVVLLRSLALALRAAGVDIPHVIFSSNEESKARINVSEVPDPSSFHDTWTDVFPESQIWDESPVLGAIERARRIASPVQATHVLITGSQHLVGPALRVLQRTS